MLLWFELAIVSRRVRADTLAFRAGAQASSHSLAALVKENSTVSPGACAVAQGAGLTAYGLETQGASNKQMTEAPSCLQRPRVLVVCHTAL